MEEVDLVDVAEQFEETTTPPPVPSRAGHAAYRRESTGNAISLPPPPLIPGYRPPVPIALPNRRASVQTSKSTGSVEVGYSPRSPSSHVFPQSEYVILAVLRKEQHHLVVVRVGLLLSGRHVIQWGSLMLLIPIVSPRIGNFRLSLPLLLTLGVMLIYQCLGQMQVNRRLPLLNPRHPQPNVNPNHPNYNSLQTIS